MLVLALCLFFSCPGSRRRGVKCVSAQLGHMTDKIAGEFLITLPRRESAALKLVSYSYTVWPKTGSTFRPKTKTAPKMRLRFQPETKTKTKTNMCILNKKKR